MSNHSQEASDSPALARNRTMDVIVALLIIALASVFMLDSWRVGIGWIEGQGPSPGSFPFWISAIMGAASLVNLVRALARVEPGGEETFVTRSAIVRVLLVLLPTAVYVYLIQVIGIYAASAIFIVGFMLASGEGGVKAIAVGLGIPIALFFMFEKWFLVPLPKGPLEAVLGL